MKKILFSLAGMALCMLALTGCNNDNCCVTRLAGIYTSASVTDTSTVILMPNGQKDMIMIQVLDSNSTDSIFLTPVVALDDQKKIGEFRDTASGWTGNFIFSDYGRSAVLYMTNQKTGRELPVISLTKSQFGYTLAGNWANAENPAANHMEIYLCRPGFYDRGWLTIDSVTQWVYINGPSNTYGKGRILWPVGSVLYYAPFQLSALNDVDCAQTIQIYLDDTTTLEMTRLIGEELKSE